MDNINVIKTDKFKNNAVSVIMPLDLDDKITDYNLIAAILKRGCERYPSTSEIWKHLQDLYGAVFDIVVSKKGEKLILNFYMQFIDNRFALNGEDILDEALQFISEIINNPLIEGSGFVKAYFDTERENLRTLINSRIDNKDIYAVERMEEILTEGEPYSLYKYGTIERLEKIDNSELLSLWKETYEKGQMFLFACGNVDEKIIREKAKSILNHSDKNNIVIPSAEPKKDAPEVIENMDVNQAKLSIGCRTDITIFNGDYHGLAVMNSILGGGTHSKLFNEVREKNSLAYYSYSFIEKFKGLLIIASGIDYKNYEKAKSICLLQIENMKSGKITENELVSSKKKLISDLKTVSDSQYSIIDYLSALRVFGIKYDIDDVINEIDKVTIDRVVKCAESLKLNGLYCLTK